MEKNKIDRVIEAFRSYRNLKEEGMVNGTSSPTNKTGPAIANFDPLLVSGKRKKNGTVDFRRIPSPHKPWVKSIDK
jgi:hypothetical protein